MHLDHYDFYINSRYKDYEFYSEGPNGRIKKVVRYVKIRDTPEPVYNLGFGDLNEDTGEISDLSISNNSDRDKILATVAFTVLDFCHTFGRPYIFIEGSTPARTRLYQMGISRMYTEISTQFDVYGLSDYQWQPFQNKTNYTAFLVKRK